MAHRHVSIPDMYILSNFHLALVDFHSKSDDTEVKYYVHIYGMRYIVTEIDTISNKYERLVEVFS